MTWTAWIVMAFIFVILEIGMPSTFFFACLSIGALFAAAAAYFGLSGWFDFVIFAVISVISIFTIRPLFKKTMAKADSAKSNVDALIDAHAMVTEKITPSKAGFVKVQSEIWLAESDVEIEAGKEVKIKSISGTKVFVERKDS